MRDESETTTEEATEKTTAAPTIAGFAGLAGLTTNAVSGTGRGRRRML
jgi:hypothetical protein